MTFDFMIVFVLEQDNRCDSDVFCHLYDCLYQNRTTDVTVASLVTFVIVFVPEQDNRLKSLTSCFFFFFFQILTVIRL